MRAWILPWIPEIRSRSTIPDLGSQADGGHLAGKLLRWLYNLVASATGFGITANIVDCYAALIRLWQPGDRIYLLGFQPRRIYGALPRGVIAYCGVPTSGRKGSLCNSMSPVPRSLQPMQ